MLQHYDFVGLTILIRPVVYNLPSVPGPVDLDEGDIKVTKTSTPSVSIIANVSSHYCKLNQTSRIKESQSLLEVHWLSLAHYDKKSCKD